MKLLIDWKIKLNTLQFSRDTKRESMTRFIRHMTMLSRTPTAPEIESSLMNIRECLLRRETKGNWRLNISHHHYRFHVRPSLPRSAFSNSVWNPFHRSIGRGVSDNGEDGNSKPCHPSISCITSNSHHSQFTERKSLMSTRIRRENSTELRGIPRIQKMVKLF